MSDDYCDDDDDDDDKFEDSVLSVKLGQTKSWIIFVLFGRNKSENETRMKTDLSRGIDFHFKFATT